MPRPSREPSHAERAAAILEEVQAPGHRIGEVGAALRQEATIHAMLAIVGELSAIREFTQTAAENLEDREGASVGTHLHYISDWLETMSRKMQ